MRKYSHSNGVFSSRVRDFKVPSSRTHSSTARAAAFHPSKSRTAHDVREREKKRRKLADPTQLVKRGTRSNNSPAQLPSATQTAWQLAPRLIRERSFKYAFFSSRLAQAQERGTPTFSWSKKESCFSCRGLLPAQRQLASGQRNKYAPPFCREC